MHRHWRWLASGRQNVYVDQVGRALADAGHCVDILTRRDDPALPAVVELQRNVRVLHVEAGPAHFVPKEALLQHMPAFADAAHRILAHSAPCDVMHTHFFMSGWVGLALRQHFSLPLIASFHALGLVLPFVRPAARPGSPAAVRAAAAGTAQ